MEQVHDFIKNCEFIAQMGNDPFDQEKLVPYIGIKYGKYDLEVHAYLPRFPETIKDIQVHILNAFKSVMAEMLYNIQIRQSSEESINAEKERAE